MSVLDYSKWDNIQLSSDEEIETLENYGPMVPEIEELNVQNQLQEWLAFYCYFLNNPSALFS